MDLSGLKWPLIIVVVVFVGWLFTSGGVNWMVSQSTKATVGQDAERDTSDEAMLSRIGGYLMYLWRYEKAAEVFELALQRYPNGANSFYNYYRLSKAYERMDTQATYQKSYDILQDLIRLQAWTHDKRVPEMDNLSLRASKLKEVHELQENTAGAY